ncbi:hypothetical protein E5K00_09360 [Hymenobacter aquaticus]|uniref:Periplasmic heavy metal sensor n=1 Tax=Hymenobacter aquaticus TaxID=1867101 RepID=A0A4Z0Q7D2_9BACT|nr:hypothetical protein [Hymenobacter aquaticus]TGE25376.1 hypothetical protein E5K00_09360 [Hymenobacter aquaticus]
MKTFFLLLTAFSLSAGVASAQTQPAQRPGGRMAQTTPEQRAEMMTKRLTQQLSLTAEQTEKVRQLALQETQQLEAVRAKYAGANDRKGMGQELKALKAQNDTQLQQILTAEQFSKYGQLQADRQEQRKARMGNRRTAGDL